MKQRLLLVLLALFTSIGWMNATVKLTVPKGATGSLSFTAAKDGTVSIGGVEQKTTSYTITKNETTDQQIEITGKLATLTVNTKVTNVVVSDAEDLTSLVFNTASEIATFTLDGSCKLKTLTANNCGLESLPDDLSKSLAEDATVNLKDNKLTNVSNLNLTQKATYYFDGNQITTWPDYTNAKATINYGSQGSVAPANLSTIANEWFDIFSKIQAKYYPMLSATDASKLSYSWRKGTSGSFSTTLIKKSDTYAGNFQFYSGGEYQSGTYQCQVSPTTGVSAPTYIVTVTVNPAQFTLKYYASPNEATTEGSHNGHFIIYKVAGNKISSGATVSKGDKLIFSAKPADKSGYVFSKYELKGLKATSTTNEYEVVGDGEAKELSAVAVFTKNTYKLTIDADTEHGHYTVINNTDNKEVSNGATLPYGTELTVKATPEEGYTPRVILNKAESSNPATANGTYTFTEGLKITTTSTLQILFDKKIQYPLMVSIVEGYNLKLNGTIYYAATTTTNKGYYVDGATNNNLPQFAAGTLITMELVEDANPNTTPQNIKKVLLNAKEIGTSTKVQFEMPAITQGAGAYVTFETSSLATLTKETNVKSKTGKDTQAFIYDGNSHAFEYVVNPSGLTGFTVKYTKDGQAVNYTTTAPTTVGTYYVFISRAKDASYAAFDTKDKYDGTNGNTYDGYKLVIEQATPTITTAPTVTVTTDGDYSISGGVAQVGGKTVAGEWAVIGSGKKAITTPENETDKTTSHKVKVAFLPTDKDNLYSLDEDEKITDNTATIEVPVNITGKDKWPTYKITATNIPSDMSLTFWNGANEVKSGSSVPKGTNLTIKLTYPAGYSGVKIKENKANGKTYSTSKNEDTWGYGQIDGALDVTVIYSGSAKTITPVIDKPAVVSYTYDGNVHTTETTTAGNDALFKTENFEVSNVAKNEDENELQRQMTITYKDAKGNTVVAPVNAGEYKVIVTIPEVKTANATYKAVTQEFEKLYIINKAKPEVSVWPKDAVVGIGKDAKTAQFIGGSADVEGTFHFIEEDKIGVPETGDEYEVKFVPADATNYAEVLSTSKAKIVVTDQRTLFISDVVNGSIKVTDQNGNELKDEQILDSKITSIKVTATPNSGYVLGTLTVNNTSISSGSSYTLGSDNVVVNATFVKQYTITLGSAPKGVKIATKPSSNVVVAGGSYTFTLNHVSGDKPTVTGASNISVSTSGSTTTVKVTNIQANATLAITLANPTAIKITTKPTLSKAGKPMGTIRVTGVNSSNECYYGDKITVTATANPGVDFAGWEGLTSIENPYEFEATNATYTFQAKYHGVLTGIESVDELNYYGGDGYIFVNCPAQGTLTIISMNGRAQKMSVSGQTRVTVPAGVYGIVLTSGSEVVRDKVVVR